MSWAEYAEEAKKSGSFDPLPVGVYNIRVDTADVKDTKTEYKGLLTRLVVTDGPLVGRSILNNMNPIKNDGKPNPYFMQTMSAYGLGVADQPEFWATLDTMGHEQSMLYIAQVLLGREATITVNHQPYNNEMQDNVKKIVPKGQTAPSVPAAPGMPVIPGVPAPAPAAAATPAAPTTPAVAAPVPATPALAPAPAPVAAPAPAVVPVAAPAPGVPQAVTAPALVPPVADPNPVAAPPVVAPPVAAPISLPPPDEAPF
jgi:Protein of unknown function (DUF669).